MKKAIILLAMAAFFSSCDKIDNPIKQTGTSCGDCEVQPTDTFVTKKAVLIEEFTGVTCNNCPKAAAEAKRLMDLYPDQVHLISIHSSNFAVPTTEYPADFRTTEGTEIYDFTDPIGVPSGLIDRSDFGTNSFSKFYNVWANKVDDILASTPVAAIGIKAVVNADESSRTVCLTPKFKAIADVSGRDIYWSAYLVENDIMAAQKMPDGSHNDSYIHKHVLRTSFNTAFGTPIENFDGSPNSVSCDSRQIVVDSEWEWSNCNIVLYVYDHDTYEVIQSIEVHL
ncbi:Outer membrane protein Omp28 [Owenweeksia hongkongensis DSM 17368]|uniref:Outer membrane protein Omp28 n=1 Tax=Owenweeksia hongkongensis (strain DSM 17368 / CIP 108786 / JCM 12287 / NRRL B-23963 / UST20020801) TaxID=926562 RepID=G8R2A8_OWEHD|nr:Omp28 family outer membrane lipoprotein [Owenweeksia hongkongensis]AEV32898.1 Outer membrane protein Omp28 [Owenweeksia hongkongensis DSM 17368]